MPRRVVVTGLGAISPNGIGKKKFWQNTCSGISGIDRISSFDPTDLSCQIAGEVQDFDSLEYFSETDLKKLSRSVPLAIAASKEALHDSAIDLAHFNEEDFESLGVIVGTGGAGFDFSEKQFEIFFTHKKNKISPYAISNSLVGMLSSEISMYFGLQGRSHVISNGCTSSTDAIGYSFNTIRSGQEDWVLTGGVEACVTPAMMVGFERMRVNPTHYNDDPTRGSRPFNLDREGFVLSEGSWMMILEDLEHANQRDALIYGEVLGYGSTCDAYHRVAIMPDGKQSTRAIHLALKDAKINKEQVDYINFHGTSTIVNDKVETLAVKNLFNSLSQKIPVSSTKSMHGHLLGAAGALEFAITVMALKNKQIPPTAHLKDQDPECDLDCVPFTGRSSPELDYALCNSFAFGGSNAVLIAKHV